MLSHLSIDSDTMLNGVANIRAFSTFVKTSRWFVSRSSRVPTVCHYGDTGGAGVRPPLRAPACITIYWITSSVSVSAG